MLRPIARSNRSPPIDPVPPIGPVPLVSCSRAVSNGVDRLGRGGGGVASRPDAGSRRVALQTSCSRGLPRTTSPDLRNERFRVHRMVTAPHRMPGSTPRVERAGPRQVDPAVSHRGLRLVDGREIPRRRRNPQDAHRQRRAVVDARGRRTDPDGVAHLDPAGRPLRAEDLRDLHPVIPCRRKRGSPQASIPGKEPKRLPRPWGRFARCRSRGNRLEGDRGTSARSAGRIPDCHLKKGSRGTVGIEGPPYGSCGSGADRPADGSVAVGLSLRSRRLATPDPGHTPTADLRRPPGPSDLDAIASIANLNGGLPGGDGVRRSAAGAGVPHARRRALLDGHGGGAPGDGSADMGRRRRAGVAHRADVQIALPSCRAAVDRDGRRARHDRPSVNGQIPCSSSGGHSSIVTYAW